MSRHALRSALLLFLLALPAAAQQHPNAARGFGAGSFSAGDLDSVNLFNGNLVIRLPIGPGYPVNGKLSYQLGLVYNNNVWDYQRYDDGTNVTTQALPNRSSNAGLGWMLSLGRLNPPTSTDVDSTRAVYMSPDGALHTFYPTLHDSDPVVSGVQFTRDGTYLRYNAAASTIEFPDGTVHHFKASGFPDQISDRFGNAVTIDYNTANRWVLNDGTRTQTVFFRTDLAGSAQVADHIDFTAFGGAKATWSFLYSKDETGLDFSITGCGNTDPLTTNKPVPLLTRILLPDGSSYRMPLADYSTQSSPPCQAGMLKGMTLPTLGRIEWDYIQYSFPTGSSPRSFRQFSTGVGTRRLKDASNNVIGQWSYSTALTADANFSQTQELVTTVITPLGDKEVHNFSVSTTAAASGWSALDYGLPFSRYVTDGGSLTRYLSSRIYDCDPGAVNCVLKRSNFVTYDRDDSNLNVVLEENTRKNQRVLSTRTNYDDVPGLLAAVVYGSFDGLGHYRQADLYGSFGAGDNRTTVVNYNPGQTYPGAFTPLPAGSPWILDTYTDSTVIEGGVSAKSEACFDAATGFLLRTRALASGTARSGNDVVVRYTPDAQGNVGSEESFGGDGAGLDTAASLCNLFLLANQYQINYTYQFGALASAQASPGIPFKTIDRVIDGPSGLTASSRDSALLNTSYEYDALGRPTYVKPAQDAWTQILYTSATSPSALAQTYVARQGNGGGAILAESKTLFDSLGRAIQDQQRMPDGTWSARNTAYNALGWKTSVSELGSSWTTSFLNYDPFGRPGTIRPPDGSAHDLTLTYSGVRTVTRSAKVATSYNATTGTTSETVASTIETYDRQGRLVQVTEPNGVATKYDYDVGSRLKRVCQKASGSTCGQQRFFTYDNRGFLLSEQHPEKGTAGNGTVSYLNYDSRGHARQVIDGPHDLTYTYDRAERITQIQETGSARTLKKFIYGVDNPVDNYRLGKIQQALRYNYPVLGGTPHTALITETYTYGGRQGRVSQRDTQLSVDQGTNESFTQSFGWGDLGNPQTVNYPQCTFAACVSPARAVTDLYTNGFLTGISGYTGTAPGQAASVGITYHPNGMVKEIAHGNGVVVTQANDPNGMARPSSISAALDGSTLWTTGTYKYDGTGNIWKTGTSWYEYDSLSRLKTGTVFPTPLGSGTQHQQAYSFDDYGNLQSITTQIGTGTPITRSTPASATTNRLTGAVAYDSAGNLPSWNGAVYTYDAFDQMSRMTSGTEDWIYVYDADDERIWSYNLPLNVSRWTIRDLGGKVLRDFSNNNGTWSVAEDYIYRDGLLFADYLGNGQRRHFALDHLGTVRLITNSAGTQTGYHVYYPFGEEATPYDVNADRMQFTGHERDWNSQTGTNPAADDLDYMHARFFNPLPGRFLGVDAAGGNPRAPQSWNRYVYVVDNPLKYSDPTGMQEVRFSGDSITYIYSFGNDTSIDWSSINNFFFTSYNFFSGGANAFSSNFLLGYGRYNNDAPGYRLGQAVGDLASIPYGLEEALLGGGTEVGGFLLDLTGVGAIIGVPANVLGGAMIVQGSAASGLGYVHFMEGIKGGAGGEKTVHGDITLSGGRGGSNVKELTGPPNSVVKGSKGRIFITNEKGQVVLDITKNRAKPVTPGQGFGPKRPPTQQELDLINKLHGGGR